MAHTTKIFKSETDLQIPKEVGDLDKLIIDVLLKPRIAEQAGCMNYESITNATKMTNNFLSEKTSMSFLMWTLRCTCIALGPLVSLSCSFCMCGPPSEL